MLLVVVIIIAPIVLLAFFYQSCLVAELYHEDTPSTLERLFSPSNQFAVRSILTNTFSRGLIVFAVAFSCLISIETIFFFFVYDLRGHTAPRAPSGTPRIVLQYTIAFMVVCALSLCLGTWSLSLLW